VRLVAAAGLEALAAGVAGERVVQAQLEARELGRLVHDHVVVADAVDGAEGRPDRSLAPVGAEGAGNARQVLAGDSRLAAEIKLATGRGLQADGCLATEHAVALRAIAQVEAVFKNEHSLKAFAQIFGALQAPAVAAHDAIGHAGIAALEAFAGCGVGALELLVANTAVDATVQGYRGFGLSGADKAGDQSSNEQTLFHV